MGHSIDDSRYWEAKAARESAEDADVRPETDDERAHRLSIAVSAAKELYGVGSPEHRAAVERWAADRDATRAREEAEFAAAWPRELTIARRGEWNAWVRANVMGLRNAALNRAVWAREAEQGWTNESLKRAIALHNL